MRILLVDYQDSFTFNLVHELGKCVGRRPDVVDSRTVELSAWQGEVSNQWPDLVVLGPGPGNPHVAEDVGRSSHLLAIFTNRVPIFGVCLGLQILVTASGGRVIEADRVIHGKSTPVLHRGEGLFRGIPSPTPMMRYNSLIADRATLPTEFGVIAESPNGEIMGLQHIQMPIWAVQFHPESVGSADGSKLLENLIHEVRNQPQH